MVEIRATRPEDRRPLANLISRSFLNAPPDDETFERSIAAWEQGTDSLSAWDGDLPVAHARAYRVDTLVPGGQRLPTAAVSSVVCHTAYRRRGLVRALMTQLLAEARDRGQILSSLRASEATIYGRFGYGVAGRMMNATIDAQRAKPIANVAPGSMRVLVPDEVLDVVGPLYDRLMNRPGMITRPRWMTERYFRTATQLGGDAAFVAVHSDPAGVDDGFVHYSLKYDEALEEPMGVGTFEDLVGETTAVELALLAFLCDIDLIRRWKSEERPVDDPAVLAVNDPRSYKATDATWDEQWVRILDVDAALAARTFAPATGVVTIAVEDAMFDDNTGVWSIDANGAKRLGGVHPASADLSCDVATLAATYLGGTRWSHLAGVGRVQVNDPDALVVAELLFSTPHAPFCGSFF